MAAKRAAKGKTTKKKAAAVAEPDARAGGGLPEAVRKADAAGAFGRVVWLMALSPVHRRWEVAFLEDAVMQPIRLKQFKLYMKDDVPVAYVSWAGLSDDAEQNFLSNYGRPRAKDWASGENLWIMDVITPFGGREAVIGDLIQNVFADRKGKMFRPLPGKRGVEVVEWYGVNLGDTDPADLVPEEDETRMTKGKADSES